MADSVEIAKAYVQIVPSMEGAQSAITKGLGGATDKAGSKAGLDLGGSLTSSFEKKLAKFTAPAAIATALTGTAKMVFNLGESFDAAYDTIISGTGATGEELAGLEESFRNIAKSVPSDIGAVATTVADLNTRTGATGDSLEGLAKDLLYLDEIGYSTDISKMTGMMNSWGVSTDDMSMRLNQLFKVSQSTGISMDQLTSGMSGNMATMTAMGFTFEESAALVGQLDKAGLNATSTIGKLQKAATNLAKAGEEPADAYNRIVSEMKKFIDEGDKAAALNLATDMFGTRGAAEFLEAVETGAVDVGQLSESLKNADGTISQNEKATRSFGESLEILKNKAAVAFEPFGSALFTGASMVLDGLVRGFDVASEGAENLSEAIQSNATVMEIMDKAKTAIEKVGTVGSKAFDLVTKAGQKISPVLKPIASFVGGALFGNFSKIAGLLSGAVVKGLDKVSKAADTIGKGLDKLNGIISGLSFELPHFKVPHFNISGGQIPWGIGGKGTKPTIDVQWYAKGGVFDGPSIIGVGEAGPEAVVPLSGPRLKPIAEALNDAGAGGDTYNFYLSYNAGTTAAEMVQEIFREVKRVKGRG